MRIVVADDHPVVLDGLAELFSTQPDIEVVARCRTGEEALHAVRTHATDVLVLDLGMPGMGGLGVLRALAQEDSTAAVALYTGGHDEPAMIEAVRLGVRGVVLKEMPPRVLLECVRALHAGTRWFEHSQ